MTKERLLNKLNERTNRSVWVEEISSVVVSAKNKDSAKELGQAIVRDYYNGSEYMTKQYKYIIEKE